MCINGYLVNGITIFFLNRPLPTNNITFPSFSIFLIGCPHCFSSLLISMSSGIPPINPIDAESTKKNVNQLSLMLCSFYATLEIEIYLYYKKAVLV